MVQRHQRIIISIVVLSILTGLTAVVLDWNEARSLVHHVNWGVGLLALLSTAISYGCISYGFSAVNIIFGIKLGKRDLLEIGFVSAALGHLSVGAVGGNSLRILLMQRRGLKTGDILAASLFYSYFSSLVLFALLPIGLTHILVSQPISRGAALGVGFAVVLLVFVLFLATATVFIRSSRAVVMRALGGGWRFLTGRDIGPSLRDFGFALARGMVKIHDRPSVLVLPVGLIIADWMFSVAALWFSFDAFGEILEPGVLLTGFTIGIAAGLLSMVPGGLGVQEVSMAGIYALQGVSFEHALLASIMFRVVYYFIPFFISFGFYRRLLRSGQV